MATLCPIRALLCIKESLLNLSVFVLVSPFYDCFLGDFSSELMFSGTAVMKC